MRLSEHIALGKEEREVAKFTGQVRVLVQDLRDKPIPGIEIEVRNGVSTVRQKTDSGGVAIIPFETSSDEITVEARLPENVVSIQKVKTDQALKEPIAFRSVVISPEPFLTPVEAVSGGLGVAIGAIGFIKNIEWMKILGESLFVVALFSKMARSR